jgi:hypothetical protein
MLWPGSSRNVRDGPPVNKALKVLADDHADSKKLVHSSHNEAILSYDWKAERVHA